MAESVLSVASAEALLSVEGSGSARVDKKAQLTSLVNSLSLNDTPVTHALQSTNLHKILGAEDDLPEKMPPCPSISTDEEKDENIGDSNYAGRRRRAPSAAEGKRESRQTKSQPMSVSVPNLTSADSEPPAQSFLETFAAVTGRRLAGGGVGDSSNDDGCAMGSNLHANIEGVGNDLRCGTGRHPQHRQQRQPPLPQLAPPQQQTQPQQSIIRGAIPSLSGGSLFPASTTHSVSSLVRLALSSHFHFPG